MMKWEEIGTKKALISGRAAEVPWERHIPQNKLILKNWLRVNIISLKPKVQNYPNKSHEGNNATFVEHINKKKQS